MIIKFRCPLPQGLHFRPCGLLARALQSKQVEVTVRCRGRNVNRKSVIGLFLLGVRMGDEVAVILCGADSLLAAEALNKMVSQKFFES